MNNILKKLRCAKSIEINQKVYEKKRRGEKTITLSLGEAYFDIPDFGFSEIDHYIGYHYSDSQGLPLLRKALSDNYLNEHGLLVPEKNIVISAGSKILTYLTMLLTLNKDDEVILHEPAWLSYQDQATLCNANTKYIPFNIDIADFHNYLSDQTKLIVINNPNNPAGWIYNALHLKNLIHIAHSKGIFVLVDEAYSDFVKQNSEFNSATSLVNLYENLIVVNSISKNFGMSGWRIGYAVMNECHIKNMITLNQHTITCAPTVLQIYLAKNLNEIQSACNQQINELLIKRDNVKSLLDKYEFIYLNGGATFYFFVDLGEFLKETDSFAEYILEHYGIAIVPGSAYGETTKQFIRLSFGTEDLDDIESALITIRQCLLNDFS